MIKTIFSGSTYNTILLILKALGITILAFILSLALEAPFTASTSAIFSNPEKNDFTLSDIYAQIADNRPVRTLDDRIAIVDIGHGGREEIAEILEMLALCGPKAVGVDINFEDPHDDDSRLLNAISAIPGTVLPLGVEAGKRGFKISDAPFFHDTLQGPVYGVINFPAASSKSSIREFAVEFPMTDGSHVPSFVTALLEKSDPEAAARLRERGNTYETSSYHSREYNITDLEGIINNPENIAGKTVLIGALDEASDMHATPVNSYMPGIMIHAHALSTAMDSDWYGILPRWADYLIACAVCFIIVLATTGIRNGVRGLIVRILQIVLAYLAVRVGYTLFVDHHLICNFSNTLLMIAFGLFAVDIWNGIAALLAMSTTRIKELRKRNRENIEISI